MRLLVAVLVLVAAGATPASAADRSGDLVAYTSKGGIQVVRADGSGRRVLTEHAPTGPVASATRDGRAVFFLPSKAAGLWRLELSTRRARRIGPADPNRLDPISASPTGRFVAGFHGRDLEVWTASGERVYAVRAQPPDSYAVEPPAWSAGEKRIAYSVDPLDNAARGGLYVATIGAERAVRVASGALFDPAWSPSGRLAAVMTREPDGAGCPCEAVLVRDGRAERTEQEASDVAWTGRNELLVRTPQQTLLLEGREVANRVGPLWGTSPDGDSALVQRRGRFVVVPLYGGESRVLAAGASETAVWATSGEIIFDTSPGELHAIDAATGSERRQLTFQVADSEPVVAPSGDAVAFTRATPRGESVWIVPTAGGRTRRVSDGSRPTWAPDGKTLIVSRGGPSYSDETQLALYAVARDGSRQRWLARGSSARWSPDGSRIAYVTRRTTWSRARGMRYHRTVWLMWADSRRPRRRLHVTANTPLWGPPVWLDGHAHVAYGVREGIYAAGGDRPRPILAHPQRLAGPPLAASPDGEWIAAPYRDRQYVYAARGLVIVSRDGRRRHVVRRGDVRDVRWLSNGQIVYTACIAGCAVYAVPLGGRGPHRLIARGALR
jgi:hypothetical protein